MLARSSRRRRGDLRVHAAHHRAPAPVRDLVERPPCGGEDDPQVGRVGSRRAARRGNRLVEDRGVAARRASDPPPSLSIDP